MDTSKNSSSLSRNELIEDSSVKTATEKLTGAMTGSTTIAGTLRVQCQELDDSSNDSAISSTHSVSSESDTEKLHKLVCALKKKVTDLNGTDKATSCIQPSEAIAATATLERLTHEVSDSSKDSYSQKEFFEDISDFDISQASTAIITDQRGQSGQQGGLKKVFVAKDALAAGKGLSHELYVGDDLDRSTLSIDSLDSVNAVEAKVPRPPNAFMIFANEHRRKLAAEFPSESNKDISVRLGIMWKSLEKGKKDRYFDLARTIDAEHKKRYPNYVYNPKEARMRKAMRDQTREQNRLYNGKTPSPKKHPGDVAVKGGMRQVRLLESKRRSPMMYTPWLDTPGQYVTNESYMDAPYQGHEPGYNMMAPNPWYQYMQQDMSGMGYAQAWSQHGSAASYMQQRMYDASAHNYSMSYEPAQSVAAQQPPPPQPPKPAGTDVNEDVASSSSQGQPSPYNDPRRPASKPTPTPTSNNQDPVHVSPTGTPNKAYHRYLTGSDGSPTASWPSMYPTAEAFQDAQVGGPISYPENVHRFTYYDDIPRRDQMPDRRRKRIPSYNPYMYHPHQVMKAHPYPISMHQVKTSNHPSNDTVEEASLTDKVSQNVAKSSEYTVIANVMNEAATEITGGRVIATYESQSKEVDEDKLIPIPSASQKKKFKAEAKNDTFKFMQDEAYKNILKSIDGIDNPRIIQQNANVCVLSNDTINDEITFACMSPLRNQNNSK